MKTLNFRFDDIEDEEEEEEEEEEGSQTTITGKALLEVIQRSMDGFDLTYEKDTNNQKKKKKKERKRRRRNPTNFHLKERKKNTTVHKKIINFKKYRNATNQWEADEK